MKGSKVTLQEGAVGHMAAVAAAAHELKTPLALINHITHALRDPQLPLTPAETAQYLHRLQLTSERMMRLVQQITLSYRLDESNQLAFAFALEPLNITEVCEQALHELTPYATECRQTLQLTTKQRCPHIIIANRDIAYDIVTNLVDNAIRHNQKGETVHLQPHCVDDHVRLQVHDNGAPIATHQLAQLRRTLGRQPQPLNGQSGTSGLGLYIVGQLARAMGGNLGLGRPNQGTTFFVDFIRSRQLSLL